MQLLTISGLRMCYLTFKEKFPNGISVFPSEKERSHPKKEFDCKHRLTKSKSHSCVTFNLLNVISIYYFSYNKTDLTTKCTNSYKRQKIGQKATQWFMSSQQNWMLSLELILTNDEGPHKFSFQILFLINKYILRKKTRILLRSKRVLHCGRPFTNSTK